MRVTESMRADVALVERGLAPTRSAAQRLISAGAVLVDRGSGPQRLAKAGDAVHASCALTVTVDDELRYVSRGGLKLEAALAACGIGPAGWTCIDVGQSTGGFTDCLLHAGAACVVGVDVGHGQLHARLANDARVAAIERFNARELSLAALQCALADSGEAGSNKVDRHASQPGSIARSRVLAPDFTGFDLAVADLSFIGLAKVLDPIASVLREGGTLVALVKPQFEAGRAHVGKGGIMRDAASYARIAHDVRAAALHAHLIPRAWLDSPITGGDGNREFFLHATKATSATT